MPGTPEAFRFDRGMKAEGAAQMGRPGEVSWNAKLGHLRNCSTPTQPTVAGQNGETGKGQEDARGRWGNSIDLRSTGNASASPSRYRSDQVGLIERERIGDGKH